jgi:hypothetical protein
MKVCAMAVIRAAMVAAAGPFASRPAARAALNTGGIVPPPAAAHPAIDRSAGRQPGHEPLQQGAAQSQDPLLPGLSISIEDLGGSGGLVGGGGARIGGQAARWERSVGHEQNFAAIAAQPDLA